MTKRLTPSLPSPYSAHEMLIAYVTQNQYEELATKIVMLS